MKVELENSLMDCMCECLGAKDVYLIFDGEILLRKTMNGWKKSGVI